ncbi:MAG: aminotransferase class V-fold PLP-dependent enzyme [Pyrinomonadaceae bacterium]
MYELDWEELRREFPVTRHTAYLNSAAAGPVLAAAAEAAINYYTEMTETGDANWEEWLEQRERARHSLARLINAEPEEIAFTTNTSSGMNLIVDALEKSGEVVSCDLEFPVTTLPWLHRGIPVYQIETANGEVHAADISEAMTSETAIISLSHVQYSNGFRADLEEIGRNKGECVFVVNASQSIGVLPLDVKRMRIDALCATGHKWMLAGYGSGFVYISRALLERTRPRAIGWMSVGEPFAMRNREFQLRGDASARAELGCPPFASIFALAASADNLLRLGTANVEGRALALNRHLTTRLIDAGWTVLSPLRDEAMRSAETLVAVETPSRVVSYLAQRNVHVTEKPQGLRVATHFFNNEADIARLIEALNETRASNS